MRDLLTALYVREALLGMALAVAGGGAVEAGICALERSWNPFLAIAASGTGAFVNQAPAGLVPDGLQSPIAGGD